MKDRKKERRWRLGPVYYSFSKSLLSFYHNEALPSKQISQSGYLLVDTLKKSLLRGRGSSQALRRQAALGEYMTHHTFAQSFVSAIRCGTFQVCPSLILGPRLCPNVTVHPYYLRLLLEQRVVSFLHITLARIFLNKELS